MTPEDRLSLATGNALLNAWALERVISTAINALRGIENDGTYICRAGSVGDVVAALRDMMPYRNAEIVEAVTEKFWDQEREDEGVRVGRIK